MKTKYLIILGLCFTLAACQYLLPKPEIIYLSEPTNNEVVAQSQAEHPDYLVYESLTFNPDAPRIRAPKPKSNGVIPIPGRGTDQGRLEDLSQSTHGYLVQLGTFFKDESLTHFLEQSDTAVQLSVHSRPDRKHGQRHAVLYPALFQSYADAFAHFETIQTEYKLTNADFWIRSVAELKSKLCDSDQNEACA